MKVRSYYTRPAYTSDFAARLRRSRMQPMGRRDLAVWRLSVFFHKGPRRRTKLNRVTWLVSLHTSRKRSVDEYRDGQPHHLVRPIDIEAFVKAFVSRYDRSLYEPTLVPAPGRRGWTLPCIAPRPGRRGAARTWRDARAARGVLSLWVLEPPRGYRAGVQGVPWYRQKRRRKPKAPRFYTPAQFRRKVKAWDAEAIARAAAGETL